MQDGTSANIASATNLARQQVYREMPNLLDMGLIEKIISTPTKYRAIPVNTCIKILKTKKMAEFAELHRAAENFLKTYNIKKNLPPEEPCQFVIASEKETIIKRYQKEITGAQISMDIIGPAIANENALLSHSPVFKKKMKQGVKIRLLSEKIRENKDILDAVSRLQESPLFEIRQIPEKPPVQLAIHDKNKVDIVVPDPSHNYADLWTNHPSIVTLAIIYFEEMWRQAQPF